MIIYLILFTDLRHLQVLKLSPQFIFYHHYDFDKKPTDFVNNNERHDIPQIGDFKRLCVVRHVPTTSQRTDN